MLLMDVLLYFVLFHPSKVQSYQYLISSPSVHWRQIWIHIPLKIQNQTQQGSNQMNQTTFWCLHMLSIWDDAPRPNQLHQQWSQHYNAFESAGADNHLFPCIHCLINPFSQMGLCISCSFSINLLDPYITFVCLDQYLKNIWRYSSIWPLSWWLARLVMLREMLHCPFADCGIIFLSNHITALLSAHSIILLNAVQDTCFFECHFVIVFYLFVIYSLFLSLGRGQTNLLQSIKFVDVSFFPFRRGSLFCWDCGTCSR